MASSPEDFTLAYLRRFSLAVVALACHSWTLSCLLAKVPLGPLRSRDVLDRTCIRLRLMSSLFFTVRSKFIWDRSDALGFEDVQNWQEYVDASTDLERLFLCFKPVNAVCFSLYEYSRRDGTTAQNKAPCVLVPKMPKSEGEIVISGDALCETLKDAVSTCEIRMLEILSRIKALSETLFELRAWVNYVPSEISNLKSELSTLYKSLQLEEIDSLQFSHRRDDLLEKLARLYRVQFADPAALDPTSRFEDVIFSSNVVHAVVVDKSDGMFFAFPKVPRAPNLLSLRLKNLGGRLFDRFADNKETLSDLQNLTLVLTHLALFDRPNCSFSTIFEGDYTKQNDDDAGLFLLRDKQLVSIGYGRRKERSIFLFERWLVFSREKGDQQIGVQRVHLEKLLLVLYRRQSVGAGVLTVYWNQGTLHRQRISGAEIYFDDMSALVIWAGFLSMATTASINGSVNQMNPEDAQTQSTWGATTASINGSVNQMKSKDAQTQLEWHAVENRPIKFLLDLGPISIHQAVEQLLPFLRNEVLSPDDSLHMLEQLDVLGNQVFEQNEIRWLQALILD